MITDQARSQVTSEVADLLHHTMETSGLDDLTVVDCLVGDLDHELMVFVNSDKTAEVFLPTMFTLAERDYIITSVNPVMMGGIRIAADPTHLVKRNRTIFKLENALAMALVINKDGLDDWVRVTSLMLEVGAQLRGPATTFDVILDDLSDVVPEMMDQLRSGVPVEWVSAAAVQQLRDFA